MSQAEARTDAEAQEWKSKLRDILDAMRMSFIKYTMHDEVRELLARRGSVVVALAHLHAVAQGPYFPGDKYFTVQMSHSQIVFWQSSVK